MPRISTGSGFLAENRQVTSQSSWHQGTVERHSEPEPHLPSWVYAVQPTAIHGQPAEPSISSGFNTSDAGRLYQLTNGQLELKQLQKRESPVTLFYYLSMSLHTQTLLHLSTWSRLCLGCLSSSFHCQHHSSVVKALDIGVSTLSHVFPDTRGSRTLRASIVAA